MGMRRLSEGAGNSPAIALRLTDDLMAGVDHIVDELQAGAPDLRASRSDAIRKLLREALLARGLLKAPKKSKASKK